MAMTLPPPVPPSGPRSITQSAVLSACPGEVGKRNAVGGLRSQFVILKAGQLKPVATKRLQAQCRRLALEPRNESVLEQPVPNDRFASITKLWTLVPESRRETEWVSRAVQLDLDRTPVRSEERDAIGRFDANAVGVAAMPNAGFHAPIVASRPQEDKSPLPQKALDTPRTRKGLATRYSAWWTYWH